MIIFLSSRGEIFASFVANSAATRSIDETLRIVRSGEVTCIFSDVGKLPEGNGSGYRLLQLLRREKLNGPRIPLYLIGETDGNVSSDVCARALGASGLIAWDLKSVLAVLGLSTQAQKNVDVGELTEGLREYIGPATDLFIEQITAAPDMVAAASALIERPSDRDSFVQKFGGYYADK